MDDDLGTNGGSSGGADRRARRSPLGLWRRLRLTVEYHGWSTLWWRIVTLPLRPTPWKARLRLGDWTVEERREARRWYRGSGRPVSIVIPTYGPVDPLLEAIASVRRTTRAAKVTIVVTDDASEPAHVAQLREIGGVRLVLAAANTGFAANVNRGIAAADPGHDVVLFNSDVLATRGWLEALQREAYEGIAADAGIVGPKLLYADDRIQHGGVHRNLGAPQWYDHRHRFKPAGHKPANVAGEALAVTGACMYIRRDLIDEIGVLDERYGMAYEDVDYCLRAWEARRSVVYCPASELYHAESVTRGTAVGERERAAQQWFWEKWGDWLQDRRVRTASGALRIVYVTQGTEVGGGHRDIFEHLNRLHARGHDVALYTLAGPPDWFDLRVPVRTFADYDALVHALEPLEAIKVATWWRTARHVWRASARRGVPVYFVQDIETSYYPESEHRRAQVLSWYRNEFRYMTISDWNAERLAELGLESELIPPGIDLETFRPLPDVERRADMIVALGRTNPLKNLPLTIDAYRALPEPRPELCLFGVEPELGQEYGVRYVESPDDEQVNELFNHAAIFVQTSRHEGFALPPLEAMATGAAVVCTDAHGNRDFCRDGENCLMPDDDPSSVRAAFDRLLEDPELRRRLGEAGIRTAAPYAWDTRIDALETFFSAVADRQRLEPLEGAVPGS